MTPAVTRTVLARLAGSASVVLDPPSDEASPHVLTESDPSAFLPSRKVRKLMGLQDELAVVAAGHAVRRAGLNYRGFRVTFPQRIEPDVIVSAFRPYQHGIKCIAVTAGETPLRYIFNRAVHSR